MEEGIDLKQSSKGPDGKEQHSTETDLKRLKDFHFYCTVCVS